MNPKHTPGPWAFGKERSWLFRGNLKSDWNYSSTTILLIHDDAFRPTEADAILIEAAPDLLEALKDAEELLRVYLLDANPVCVAARAAIAKAEGRS
ncbi:hypothetical protein [Gellertiella hungarica]|uniref:Uncharacterized protein n=1 Tax=Gellertiella hungarica TaxID=1572859 RepID=A0A7W6J8P0_9HYPH|nr:hypothetical protein [Gellertiella hungarica]MBB4066792.1 hypothetical protein [Gellertiella hungarica]